MRHSKDDNNDLEKLRRNGSDIVLEINIKKELAKKMRLIVWIYSQGEYLYLLSVRWLTMR